MREAKEDPEFDPRRTHMVTGKDGRFEKLNQSKIVVPKNPLTVQFHCLCYAYAVPYVTFKRWKVDAFQTTKFVPDHKGKTVLTCKTWATKIYNARRMYFDHHMAVWLQKNRHRKYDSVAKKVSGIMQCMLTSKDHHGSFIYYLNPISEAEGILPTKVGGCFRG
jgi:hypothetical protein